jgi:hypothetical protein
MASLLVAVQSTDEQRRGHKGDHIGRFLWTKAQGIERQYKVVIQRNDRSST